ncbi:hypothetical protein FA95DRAFT_1600895 [Auriscalpium vulgare]|uniref:Uncharacterized protein n=1 Tax=Auriscalpium vulgare TaxID=40419 RepID=A0ACB8SD02_9AGAM|nr:hypothetical protein FA95DRAFT_1600895 [Auriscalpium vulgare]
MAIKRKLETDDADVSTLRAKQLRLASFAAYQPGMDVEMSDCDATPSPAESYSSQPSYPAPSSASPCYPSFAVTPQPFFGPDGKVNTNSHNFAALVNARAR